MINQTRPSSEKNARQALKPGSRTVSANPDGFWRSAVMWSALAFVVVVAVAALGWTYWQGYMPWFGGFAQRRGQLTEDAVKPEPVEKRRALDGQAVAADYVEPDVFAVMIDNMVEARPSSGVAAARLVVEAPAEGGITRFLAFYPADEKVAKIGPVRSARPYYLDWAGELDALYAHCGGSPEALTKLKSLSLRDLNEFFRGKYFWRDTGRDAPHNVYTSTDLLNSAANAVFPDHVLTPAAAWPYKDEAPLEARPETAPDISVDFSVEAYRAVWRYDRATNDYRRYQNETPARDDGAAIRAKNVVVQYVKVVILDEVGRRRITTTGEGEALVANDGVVTPAVWRRSAGGRTAYFDENGQPIAFNPGITWVEMAPTSAVVTY
ncbi:MAG: DUF3048 domain-containing protein [Patescibacteria group bacterium]|nr:DUF3048 domain-containing protein [Patescibacteria group bacterium]